MDSLQRLLAIEEIKTLEARRGRFLDSQDWAAYSALHLPVLRSGVPGAEEQTDLAASVEWLRAELHGAITVHHVHSPEIEFTTADHATAIWAMEAMTTFRRADRPAWRHGYGYYHVEYERRDGVWKIAGRRQQRVRVDTGGGPVD
jgi:hypothetical protein